MKDSVDVVGFPTRHGSAATPEFPAATDDELVRRVLRHASVTTTTGTYAHLAIEDLRDAVNKIGPQPSEPSPVADRLRTSLGPAPAANEDACPKVPENAALSGAPGGSRTPGPRLRRPLLYPAELQARPSHCTVRAGVVGAGSWGPVCLDGP